MKRKDTRGFLFSIEGEDEREGKAEGCYLRYLYVPRASAVL